MENTFKRLREYHPRYKVTIGHSACPCCKSKPLTGCHGTYATWACGTEVKGDWRTGETLMRRTTECYQSEINDLYVRLRDATSRTHATEADPHYYDHKPGDPACSCDFARIWLSWPFECRNCGRLLPKQDNTPAAFSADEQHE